MCKECEICENFDEHPYVREGDWTNYCNQYDVPIEKALEIVISAHLCKYYKEGE